jgi:hypothetical protein
MLLLTGIRLLLNDNTVPTNTLRYKGSDRKYQTPAHRYQAPAHRYQPNTHRYPLFLLTSTISPIGILYTVKKANDFPVPSRDVTYQTLPGRE